MNLTTAIEAHFNEIVSTKDRIRDLLGKMKVVSESSLTGHMDNTRICWKESTCDLFVNKENRLNDSLIYETKIIESVIDEIENVTNNLWITEMINQGVGLIRKYGL